MAQLLLALGASGGTLATVGAAAEIAAPVLGIMGSVSSYKAQSDQATAYRQAATRTEVAENLNAARMRRKARVQQSRDRLAMAEAGALSGTAYGVITQNAVERELDALTVEYRGREQAAGMRAEAAATEPSVLSIFSSAVSGFSDFDPLNVDDGI